jgi:hypothetical protein
MLMRESVKRGAKLKVIGEALGHSSAAFTLVSRIRVFVGVGRESGRGGKLICANRNVILVSFSNFPEAGNFPRLPLSCLFSAPVRGALF